MNNSPRGSFTSPAEKSDMMCRKCGSQDVIVRTWDSDDGAFTDYWHKCNVCGHTWWIEGPDA